VADIVASGEFLILLMTCDSKCSGKLSMAGEKSEQDGCETRLKRLKTDAHAAAAAALQSKFVSYGDAVETAAAEPADVHTSQTGVATKFSVDWFSHNIHRITSALLGAGLYGKVQSALEVGCFEGRSTIWFIENVMMAQSNESCKMVCIDTFSGDVALEMSGRTSSEVEETFDNNIQLSGLAKRPVQVCKRKGQSLEQLMLLNQESWMFDFIYIDGSHEAPTVLSDSVLAFPMLKCGGVLVWDDYKWDELVDLPEHQCPRVAIDAFMQVHKHELVVLDKGYQLIVQKIARNTRDPH